MSDMGPLPKRSTQRRRKNKPEHEIDQAPSGLPATAPPPDEHWHPVARRWYEALGESGQSVYYERSDWATAYTVAESLSRDLKPQFLGLDGEGEPIVRAVPIKGSALQAYLKAMANLLVTEGDRRRAHLELQKSSAEQDTQQASVTRLRALDDSLTG